MRVFVGARSLPLPGVTPNRPRMSPTRKHVCSVGGSSDSRMAYVLRNTVLQGAWASMMVGATGVASTEGAQGGMGWSKRTAEREGGSTQGAHRGGSGAVRPHKAVVTNTYVLPLGGKGRR